MITLTLARLPSIDHTAAWDALPADAASAPLLVYARINALTGTPCAETPAAIGFQFYAMWRSITEAAPHLW